MDEILLTVLNEVREDATKQIAEMESSIESAERDLRGAEKSVEGLEKERKCKVYQDEQARKKVEALRIYLVSLQNPPSILREKLDKLELEKSRAAKTRELADDAMDRAYDSLRDKRDFLNMSRRNCETLKKEWNGLSTLIAQQK